MNKINKLFLLLKSWRKKTFLNPCPLFRTFYFNFCRKNTFRKGQRSVLFSTSYSVLDIHKSAKLIITDWNVFGFKKYKNSKLETSLWMDEDAVFEIGTSEGMCSISHGSDIQIFKGARLKIGNCAINRNVQIICQNEITIGDGVLISRDVVIRDNDGGHEILTPDYKVSAPVHIGNHVWIGQGAMIMKGVSIGDGAIIGAGAVVCSNVKERALVMADPARTFAKNIEWKA